MAAVPTSNRNYSEDDVVKKIGSADIVSTRIYQLLPEYLRSSDNDSADVLKGFFGAVQEEFDRQKGSIQDILMLVDPLGVNNKFIFEGNLSFVNTNQFIKYSAGTTLSITLNDNPPGVSGSDYYASFGVYFLKDNNSTVNGIIRGSYRKVTSYNGSTKVATLSYPLGSAATTGTVILCYPDRVWLPAPVVGDPRDTASGTTLPIQQGITSTFFVKLPELSYLSGVDNYYNGYTIEMLDGVCKGQRRVIRGYVAATKVIELDQPFDTINPSSGDWFRIYSETKSSSTKPDFYKDRFIRILSGPTDQTGGFSTEIQTRRIVRSEYDPLAIPASHVCYVYDTATKEGQTFDVPPDPTSYFGITNHYVSLNYLARQVGYELDAKDPEELQKQQVFQAFNFFKLKGTYRAFETICRSFGLEPEVQELSSPYTRPDYKFDLRASFTQTPDPYDPIYPDVGPLSPAEPHPQDGWSAVQPVYEEGLGPDTVPAAYLTPTGKLTARVPDSNINVYVMRINNKLQYTPELLNRLADKLTYVTPIHIEILTLGFGQFVKEKVVATDSMSQAWSYYPNETVVATETFTTSRWSDFRKYDETAIATEVIIVTQPLRYDQNLGRWTNPSSTNKKHDRFDIGIVHYTSG